MKILMVTDSFYPQAGGAETVVLQESRQLAKRGHEVSVLAGTPHGELAGEERWQGLRIYRFPIITRNFPVYCASTILQARRWVEQLLSAQRFDVLNFHSPLSCLGVCAHPGSRTIPRVVNFYAPWREEFQFEAAVRIRQASPGRRLWLRTKFGAIARTEGYLHERALASCHAIRVMSLYSAQQIEAHFPRVPLTHVHLIQAGVDLGRFEPKDGRDVARQRLGLPQDTKIVLSIRRLVPRMGLEALIEATQILLDTHLEVKLVIVGTGFYEAALREFVSQRGLQGRVVFTGYVQESQLPLYYRAADLFVLPSAALEAFGLVTLEALASGTPVLATTVGASGELLRGLDEQMLMASRNPSDIAARLERVLSSKDSDLSRRCREYAVTKFNWGEKVVLLEGLYRSLNGKSQQKDTVETIQGDIPP